MRNTEGCNFSLLPEFDEGGSDLLHPKKMKFVQSILKHVGRSKYLSDRLSAFPLAFLDPLYKFLANVTENQPSQKDLSFNIFSEGGRGKEGNSINVPTEERPVYGFCPY